MWGATTAAAKKISNSVLQGPSCKLVWRLISCSWFVASQVSISPEPSKTKNRATIPKIVIAISFTKDSNARAKTKPSCFSRGETWRAPNRMANTTMVKQKPKASVDDGKSAFNKCILSETAAICRVSNGSATAKVNNVTMTPAKRLR